jgi:CHASE3 domain sensor protein
MSETVKIPFKDVRKWLEQETLPIVEPLRAEGKTLLDDIKSKLNDVQETSDKLLENAEKEMTKGVTKTYRRARVLAKLAKSFLEMIEKVNIPDQISREKLHMAVEDLERTLETMGRERGRWFPLISPYFIIDRRRFDVVLKRAADSIKELRDFSSNEYAKAEIVEKAFFIIDKLSQSSIELAEAKEHMKKTESRREILEKQIAENQQKITLIQSKSEVVDLVRVNEEIEELKKKVKHNLRHLQKPFLKFQTLASGPSYPLPPDELKKLGEYLSNPFEAFATEPEGYPTLKKILQKMEDAMAEGKLKLKSSRLRNAKDQIDSVLKKDSLAPLHQNCTEILSQMQQLAMSRTIASSRNEAAQLQEDLKDLVKQKELADSRGAVLENEIRKTSEKIEEQKKELEKTILELTDKNVQIDL